MLWSQIDPVSSAMALWPRPLLISPSALFPRGWLCLLPLLIVVWPRVHVRRAAAWKHGGSYQFGTFPLKKSRSWYNRGDTLGIWSDTPCSSNMCTVYYYCADKYSTTRCSIASYSLMTHSCSSDTAYQCTDTCAATGPFT